MHGDTATTDGAPAAAPVQTLATHVIGPSDLQAWLTEYGLRPDDVMEATVVLGYSQRAGDAAAWLDVTWYKRDADDHRYEDPQNPGHAATGQCSLPLHSWPRLSPARAVDLPR